MDGRWAVMSDRVEVDCRIAVGGNLSIAIAEVEVLRQAHFRSASVFRRSVTRSCLITPQPHNPANDRRRHVYEQEQRESTSSRY